MYTLSHLNDRPIRWVWDLSWDHVRNVFSNCDGAGFGRNWDFETQVSAQQVGDSNVEFESLLLVSRGRIQTCPCIKWSGVWMGPVQCDFDVCGPCHSQSSIYQQMGYVSDCAVRYQYICMRVGGWSRFMSMSPVAGLVQKSRQL